MTIAPASHTYTVTDYNGEVIHRTKAGYSLALEDIQ